MKVLAILVIVMALVVVIVPQFTNCEYGVDNLTTKSITIVTTGSAASGEGAGMAGAEATTLPYRMMKCFWSARAEIAVGVTLFAVGVLLFFARRKGTTRALGILAAVLGVLAIVIPTRLIGTCLNDQMVCNTEMKPTMFITGGIAIALGVAVLVIGEFRRETDDDEPAPA